MNLIRFPKLTPLVRAGNGPSADDYSPWDERNNAGFGIVRGNNPAQYTAAGETIRRKGFEGNAIVNACIRVIADQVGVARLEGYGVEDDGTVVLYPTEPLQELLDQPAPQLSGFGFRRTLALHLTMYGNAYAQIIRSKNGAVDRLRLIHPERLVNIVIDGTTDEIVQYQWADSSGRQRLSPWTDILHVKDALVDPDGWFGFPRGLAALLSMATDIEASAYVRQVLGNSGVPSLVLFGRQGAGIDELQRAENAWHEKMAIGGGRGRTRFLGGIESLQVIGHSLKDLEFPSLRQISREDICAAFGVDPRLIGASSAKGNEGGLSGSQYQEARRRLEQQTCQPLRLAMTEAMDLTISPEFGFRYVRFAPDAIASIIETPTEIAQRTAILVASNVTTLEEARSMNGLPEMMDPAHTTAAAMLQTIQDALEANEREEEAQDAMLAAKTASSVNKEASVSEQADAPDGSTDINNGRSATRQDRAVSRIRVGEMPSMSETDEQAAWESFDARARALEPQIAAAAEAAIEEVIRSVLHTLEQSQDADTIRASNDPWWDRFLRGMGALFSGDGPVRRMWVRMFARRMTDIAEQIGMDFAEEARSTFRSDDPSFVAGIRQRWTTLAESATGTIAKRIGEVVAAGRAANLSASEIASLVRGMDFRAMIRRIAATESVGLINHAEMLAAQQATSLRKKKWLSQRDERVRSSHRACDSQGYIDIEAAFQNGLRYAHDPNGSADEVDNCRCTTIYSDREVTI